MTCPTLALGLEQSPSFLGKSARLLVRLKGLPHRPGSGVKKAFHLGCGIITSNHTEYNPGYFERSVTRWLLSGTVVRVPIMDIRKKRQNQRKRRFCIRAWLKPKNRSRFGRIFIKLLEKESPVGFCNYYFERSEKFLYSVSIVNFFSSFSKHLLLRTK